jgi:DNA-binding response OmpR family regulator
MPKLLIVDDDIHLRKLVMTYAELEGFQCEETDSVPTSLAAFL